MRRYILLQKATLLLLMISIALVACGKDQANGDWMIQNFNYTDQEGQPFGLADLKGKIWIADLIFTSCATVCPPMTANMKRLQDRLKSQGLDVELVSFSVDPEVDTPARLKEYAGKFEADLTNWHLLTGYTQQEIETFAKENFKTIVQKPEGEDQVTHGTSFYLIDQKGNVVSYYDGVNPPFEEIIKKIKKLN